MRNITRCDVELCADCAAGRSTRPLIECQHIGPDDAGEVVEFVRADIHQGAVDALCRIVDEAASGRIITLHGAVQIAQASLNDAGGQ